MKKVSLALVIVVCLPPYLPAQDAKEPKFIRLKEETEVRSGDVLLMGQQLFRVTM